MLVQYYDTFVTSSDVNRLTTFAYSGQVSHGGWVTAGSSAQTLVMSTATPRAVVWSAPNNTEEKIRSFSTLPVGWHYGSGRAPSPEMIATAIQWHRHLTGLGFTVIDAFPGINGEIMVTAYEGAHYVELLLDTISTVSLIHERDGKEVRSLDQVTPDQARRALGEFTGEIWNTSGYFIQSISTVNTASLRASRSRSMTTERPSSSWPVLLESGSASANTYENIIPTSGAIRLYSGSLTKPSSPRIAA
jgi:hypothetical protein